MKRNHDEVSKERFPSDLITICKFNDLELCVVLKEKEHDSNIPQLPNELHLSLAEYGGDVSLSENQN